MENDAAAMSPGMPEETELPVTIDGRVSGIALNPPVCSYTKSVWATSGKLRGRTPDAKLKASDG